MLDRIQRISKQDVSFPNIVETGTNVRQTQYMSVLADKDVGHNRADCAKGAGVVRWCMRRMQAKWQTVRIKDGAFGCFWSSADFEKEQFNIYIYI